MLKVLLVGGGTPGAPTIGTATAGNTLATVTFTAPAYTGKGDTVYYVATSTPSSIVASSLTSPITVTGLVNGTPYTFTVKTDNSGIFSALSAASNSVTPTAPTTTTTTTPATTTTTTPAPGPTTTPATTTTTTTTTTTAAPPPPTCGCVNGSTGTRPCNGPTNTPNCPGTLIGNQQYTLTQCNFSPPGCSCPACGNEVLIGGCVSPWTCP